MSNLSRASVSVLLVLALVGLVACDRADPLERVRVLQDGNHDHAAVIEPLQELLAERPDDPELNYRYGTALFATGRRGLAVFALENAMESPEWRPLAAPLLISSHIAAQGHTQALAVCDELLEEEPDNIAYRMLRARVRMVTKTDFEAMLADAEHVLELDPDHHEALVPRAVALLGLERLDEAEKAIEELEALYRDESLGLQGSPGLCIARASFAEEKGELETAEERYEACYEDFPNDPVVIEASAKFFDGIGKPERTLELLQSAAEELPDSGELTLAIALRLRAQGKPEEGEAVLEAAADRATGLGAADAWAALGAYRIESGDPDEAVAAFEKARAFDTTKSPQLVLGHADALIAAERYEDALALAETMQTRAHRAAVSGRALLGMGRAEEAQEYFDEGLRLWPDSAVARYYSAVCAEQLGEFARAVEDYRYSMRIDVNATDAYLRLARLHAAAGQYEQTLWALEFQPGARPEEVEAALLQVRVLARLGKLQEAPPTLTQRLAAAGRIGSTVAAMGEGVRQRQGREAAVRMMRAFQPLDLTDPAFAEALEAIIEDLGALDRGDEGLALAEASLAAEPDATIFQVLRARALHLAGRPPEAVRKAYRAVLQDDPDDERALRGLARLEAEEGDAKAAWAFYEQSLALDPHDNDTALAGAETLVILERPSDAEEVLATLLQEHPYDAAAARRLAELRVDRGEVDQRTRDLARRAVSFGGGEEARNLFEKLRGDEAPAAGSG